MNTVRKRILLKLQLGKLKSLVTYQHVALHSSLGTFEIVLSAQKHLKYSVSLRASPLRWGKKTQTKYFFKKKRIKSEKKNLM